jgi:uncharacterized membrane protein YkvA (DUF1232 family)
MKRELHQFIAEGSRKITPAKVGKLVRQLADIRLAVTQITDYPRLADQVEFLAELIEDFHAGYNKDIPYTAIAEAAFALSYVRKAVDLVPDEIPRTGYADDAAIVTAVFENYKEVFLKHVIDRSTRKRVTDKS